MTEQLLNDFEPYITELTLLPSDGGRFEVTLNDQLIYSKKATGRHVEYSEVADSVRKHL